MATAEMLMTLEEFSQLAADGKMRELVKGVVCEMNPPKPRHGMICTKVAFHIYAYVQQKKLGWVLTNDAGIITQRNPDSLRGADVAFYSYARVPQGKLSNQYLSVSPDLVCEVMSEYDRWKDVMAKATEYLQAGVTAVCIFHPDHETITIVRGDREPEVLHAQDEFTLPEILGDFRVAVREFFA